MTLRDRREGIYKICSELKLIISVRFRALERLQMPVYRFFHVLDTSKTSDYHEESSRGVGEGGGGGTVLKSFPLFPTTISRCFFCRQLKLKSHFHSGKFCKMWLADTNFPSEKNLFEVENFQLLTMIFSGNFLSVEIFLEWKWTLWDIFPYDFFGFVSVFRLQNMPYSFVPY